MLTFDQIEYFAKLKNRPLSHKRQIIVEYLHYEILNSLNKSRLSRHLNFIGGTALCICYQLPRFSEDLDFDNFGLNKQNFNMLIAEIKNDLESKGFKIETKITFQEAFHAYFKFSEILNIYQVASQKQEKILVKFDTVSQNIKIKPELIHIDSFGISELLRVNPLNILLSQKILTILNRPQPKGRDYFDVSWLASQVKPDFAYLKKKSDIKNAHDLKKRLLKQLEKINLNSLARDVEPLLFNSESTSRVKQFPYIINKL